MHLFQLVACTVVFLLAVIAVTAVVPDNARATPAYAYGDVVEVAPDVLLVIGRPLDFAKREVDVANAVFYKSGSTLVVVDTGGTAGFVPFLDAAAARLRPYDKVLLVSSHGHADHVGNNNWIDTLGVPARHVMSLHDLAAMRDQVGYFAAGFDEAAPYLADMPSGRAYAQEIVDLFGGLHVESRSLTLLESLPLESVTIGSTAWNGWRLLDGAVLVLRTSGHTAGHVAVFLPGPKVLHLADETTGFYQTFPDARPAANLLSLQRAVNALKAGAVTAVTDGHSFAVHRGDEAVAYLTGLTDAAIAFDAAVTRILKENPKGITIPKLVSQVGRAPELADAPGGANAVPVFSYMEVMNKLRELGVGLPAKPMAPVSFPD